MPGRLRSAGARAILLAGLLPAASAEEPEANLARLRTMSREHRESLSKTLDAFDGLGREERDAIRDLDAKLAGLDSETRARYLAVLRRYHVFLQNLPEAKRKALEAEPDPSRKLAMIAAIRAEQKASSGDAPPLGNAIQISELSRIRLRALARELVVWFSLDPKQDAKDRDEFGRMKDPATRKQFARSLVRKKNLTAKIREEEAEFLEAEAAVRKDLLKVVAEQAKAEAQKRKAALADGGSALENARRAAVYKLEEVQVFRQLDGQTVDPANLARFEAALPPWARESMDALPPDAARRRLKILYRLVFPAGTELPTPKPPEPAKSKGPRPSRPSGGPEIPF